MPLPDRARVERALAEVYARPELSPPPPSPVRAWLSEAWATLVRWVGSLFPELRLGEGGLRVVSWLVIGCLVLVAFAALIHLAGRGMGWWRSRVRRSTDPPRSHGREPELATAPAWEQRARAAAAAGRWREAALALYQALLLRLDARGAVRYDAAKTPGDYRREVRRDPAAARLFDAFLSGFEPVAFGARSLDASGYGHLQRLAAEAGAEAGTGG